MKQFFITLIGALAALLLSSCATIPGVTARLPRIPLRAGGEFRVFQISYGTEHRAKTVRRLRMDPESAQWVKESHTHTEVPAVAIWWGVVEPKSGEYSLEPSGPAFLLLRGGRKQLLEYPDGGEDAWGEIRRLFIYQPPRDQRTLRVRIPVTAAVRGAKTGGSVEFEIKNPAYAK